MSLVFVYGTLKQGHHNHGVLGKSEFVGKAFTADSFHMSCCGFPVVFKSPDTGPIYGELYNVTNDSVMARLDRLEGVPNMYTRETVRVVTAARETCSAFIYLGNDGNWVNRSRLTPVPLNAHGHFMWVGPSRLNNTRPHDGEQHV